MKGKQGFNLHEAFKLHQDDIKGFTNNTASSNWCGYYNWNYYVMVAAAIIM
jgi:hypothetical protein